MNTTHIINLFRAYFFEHKKMLLICCIISFGALAWAFANRAMPEILPITPYFIVIWVAGNFFQFSLKKNNSAHFFNLPVTAADKLIHSIVVILLLGIVIHSLALAGAYIGYYVIHPLLNTNINEIRWTIHGKMSIWEQLILIDKGAYLYYLAAISAFLFGSIYFKKNAFWITIACGIGFFFGVFLYYLALLFIVLGTIKDLGGYQYSFESTSISMLTSLFSQDNYYIIPIVLILFFLSLTYLRLKETEV